MEFDRDLQSIQEVRNLITNAKKSAGSLCLVYPGTGGSHCRRDRQGGAAHAEELAKMAVEETGFGVWQDKILKTY